jgi:predicted porin
MIGGLMKTTSRLTIATAFAAFATTGAMAADLGGNCCSDLEERVAELEATTARKGNRKVSLEVSGHVHESILLWDDGYDDGAYIVTSNFSRTRFRFKGSAKINADWSAGFLIEVGLRQPGTSGVGGADQAGLASKSMDIRHQALYVKSKSMGTIWLGHTSMAVDGIADICLGCPISSTHESSLGWGGFQTRDDFGAGFRGPDWSALGAGNNVASNGARRQLIRYISPEFAGFVFSADTGLDENSSDDARWTIALRYANEFNGVRVAGGIGYHEEDNLDGWGGSLSMMHTASGFFIAGSYGEQTDNNIVAVGEEDTTDGWSVVAGVVKKFSPLGKTTFWVRYGEYNGRTATGDVSTAAGNPNTCEAAGTCVATNIRFNGDADVIGLGINQKIDAAAMEVYVSYWNVQGGATVTTPAAGDWGADDLHAVMFGARLKF